MRRLVIILETNLSGQARSLHSDLAIERSERGQRSEARSRASVIRLGPPSASQGMLTTKKAIYFDETSSESDNTSRRPSLKSTLPQNLIQTIILASMV